MLEMKRTLAVLVIASLLVVVAVPLAISLSNSSADVGSAFGFVPAMYVPEGVDENGNRIEDLLEEVIEQKIAEGNGSQMVDVVVLLDVAPSSVHNSVFRGNGGGGVRGPWQHAVNGFAGRLPCVAVSRFAPRCPNLLLVQMDHEYEAQLAYAARQGRARPYVWDTLGYRGDPLSSIAISDTGIDDTHVNHGSYGDADFSEKIVGWRDDIASDANPYDDNGHGSHCAGIASGSGFYSTDSDGRAVATSSRYFGLLSPSYIYYVAGFNVSQSGSGQKITLNVRESGISTLYLYYSGYSGDYLKELVASYSTPASKERTFEYGIPEGEAGYYHIWVAGNGVAYMRVRIHWPYDFPDDGYPAWTGVAADAKLVGLKSLNSAGGGSTSSLVGGINWAIANRETYHILVLSMSWSTGGYDPTIDNAVSNAVGSGIICVGAAGNDGSGGNRIHTPGSNPYAISVAATSIIDNVTSYSSQGGPSESNPSVVKPDIAAPGGSARYLSILSTDSNDQDAENYYADFNGNDSATMEGTSMSTPFIAGSAAVVAQALGGYDIWDFSGGAMALQAKMLLLMTATETYPAVREVEGASSSPTLERGGKDIHEGYGRVNLDAAVEAAALTYGVGDVVSGSFGTSPLERKCWARNVYLNQRVEYRFNLSVPSGADYDLYLYNVTGTIYGEPVIVANSTGVAVGGFENITYTPAVSGSYYVVVKRAREDTGSGQFTLMSSLDQAVHLLLSLDPDQGVYSMGEELSIGVSVFNQEGPAFNSTLSLSVSGPGDYYLYDFQNIAVAADAVEEYTFVWVVQEVAGTYVVEVGLVPPQLTAYDAAWLDVG